MYLLDDHALDCIRKAGRLSAEARELGRSMVTNGVKLRDVAERMEFHIIDHGGRPAFPVNISLNDTAAHFTPNSADCIAFDNGDLVKLDVGAQVDGYLGDTATTVEVGTRNWQPLIMASERGLELVMEMAKDGISVGTIGGVIERSIKETGYRPVVNLSGHEMKRYNLHAGLSVPNIDDGSLTKVRENMLLAIEPFATNGQGQVSNGKSGNIYRVLRDRPLRDEEAKKFFDRIKEEFTTLPFCERWCDRFENNSIHLLKVLHRHGVVSTYPVLVETQNGMVSQAEHTVLVGNGRTEITTA
ncbi:MAG: type II methionyl aminopeptidase [Methanomassiliicoccales archaeon]|nr:type II methionyl aminopeptidase [Methanomassiliicoccales archaeon]